MRKGAAKRLLLGTYEVWYGMAVCRAFGVWEGGASKSEVKKGVSQVRPGTRHNYVSDMLFAELCRL